MSEVKKGSEIFKEIDKEYDEKNFKLDGSNLNYELRQIIFQKLEGMIVVPEEVMLQREKIEKELTMALRVETENRMRLEAELETTKTMASPKYIAKLQTKLERIQKLIENLNQELDKQIIELREAELDNPKLALGQRKNYWFCQKRDLLLKLGDLREELRKEFE